MPPDTRPEVVAKPVDSEAVGWDLAQHPAVLAVASAFLLWFSFPPAGRGWLAWGALAPLFVLIRSTRGRPAIYAGAWAGGITFWLLATQWVRLTDRDAWPAWLAMGLALSFWWPAFLALARLAVLRFRVPAMLAAPILWVGLEHVRAHIMTGFPWYYLAHTQHRILPLIQIADFAGALGLSFLIALVNAWLVDLRTLPLLRPTSQGARLTRPQLIRAVVVATLLAATIGYGKFRIATARFHDGPRVAMIQSNLEQRRKMSSDPDKLLRLYRSLVDRALRGAPRPDLVVWPETSFPFPFAIRDPVLGDAEYERIADGIRPRRPSAGRFWADWGRFSRTLLQDWTDQVKVPMLVGSVVHDFSPRGYAKYNSAVLFQPAVEEIQRYAKVRLVPFGEYVPLVKLLPWLTVLTPYHGSHVPSLSFGRGPSWFDLGPYRIATAICFEDTIPQAVRQFFRDPAGGRKPDVLINISNDGWFRGSSELDMHLAISVFRAVENRVPLARAVNTGISALIDGNGKVLASLPKLTEGILAGTIQLDDRISLYSSWGDWLGAACLTLTCGLIPLAVARSIVSRRFA